MPSSTTPTYSVPATVNNEQVTVGGIQGVGENAAVLTQEGRAIPLSEVGFPTVEDKVLYEVAAGFDTQEHANRFLSIYQKNPIGVKLFIDTYIDIYRNYPAQAAAGEGNTKTASSTGDKAGSVAQASPIDPQAVKELGALHLEGETLDTVNQWRAEEGLPEVDSGDAASGQQTHLEENGKSGIMEMAGEDLEAGEDGGNKGSVDTADDPGQQTADDTGNNYDPQSILTLSTRFLNRMDPMWKNSQNIKPIDGYQDIVCHGDKNGFSYIDLDGNEIAMTPREFVEILKSSPVYEEKPIRLISCQAGAVDSFTAQYIANQLGVDVLAPTDIVFVYPDREIFVGPSIFQKTGTWKMYSPQKVRKQGGNEYD